MGWVGRYQPVFGLVSGAAQHEAKRSDAFSGRWVGLAWVWCLVSGVWFLVSGVWCLVAGALFGVSLGLLLTLCLVSVVFFPVLGARLPIGGLSIGARDLGLRVGSVLVL